MLGRWLLMYSFDRWGNWSLEMRLVWSPVPTGVVELQYEASPMTLGLFTWHPSGVSILRSRVCPQSTGFSQGLKPGTEPSQVAPGQVTGSVGKLGLCLQPSIPQATIFTSHWHLGWLESLALTHCPGIELLIGPWVYECQLLFLITTFN